MHSRFRRPDTARTTAFRDQPVPPSIVAPLPIAERPRVERDPRAIWPRILVLSSILWVVVGLAWQQRQVNTQLQSIIPQKMAEAELVAGARETLTALLHEDAAGTRLIHKYLPHLDRDTLPFNIPLPGRDGPWSLYVTADLNDDGVLSIDSERLGSLVRIEIRHRGVTCESAILAP